MLIGKYGLKMEKVFVKTDPATLIKTGKSRDKALGNYILISKVSTFFLYLSFIK